MLTLDYNTTVRHQFKDVNKSRRQINLIFNKPLGKIRQWINRLTQKIIEKAIIQINTRLTAQLLYSKGILADLQSKQNALQDANLNSFIHEIDNLVLLHIAFKEEIEKIIETDKDVLFPDIATTNSLLEGTIEVQYDVLRLLKRYNKRSTIETSDLATESNKRSLISLETAAHERRTT